MSELQVVYRDVKDIKPYAGNPRDNSLGVDAVAMSIKEYGFKVPIIIDKKDEIIAGHTRILAAEKLGIKKVPCIVADDLSEAQVRAFRIADNKVAEFTTWDPAMLSIELKELQELDFNINLTGFSEDEIVENIEPYDIDEILSSINISTAVKKPIWITIRTEEDNVTKLEEGLSVIEKHGIKIERSYD